MSVLLNDISLDFLCEMITYQQCKDDFINKNEYITIYIY